MRVRVELLASAMRATRRTHARARIRVIFVRTWRTVLALTTGHSNTRLVAFFQLTKHAFGISDFVRKSSVYLSKLEVCIVWNVEVIQVSKGVGVALWTTKLSNTRLATFLLIAKHKAYISDILSNSYFQQSKLETLVLQNQRGVEVKRVRYTFHSWTRVLAHTRVRARSRSRTRVLPACTLRVTYERV